jgi:hypothetical protein
VQYLTIHTFHESSRLQRDALYNILITFCIQRIREIIERKWERNGVIPQLFLDFMKAHNSRDEYCPKFSLDFAYPQK